MLNKNPKSLALSCWSTRVLDSSGNNNGSKNMTLVNNKEGLAGKLRRVSANTAKPNW
jgi:cell shape-determining protein MreC